MEIKITYCKKWWLIRDHRIKLDKLKFLTYQVKLRTCSYFSFFFFFFLRAASALCLKAKNKVCGKVRSDQFPICSNRQKEKRLMSFLSCGWWKWSDFLFLPRTILRSIDRVLGESCGCVGGTVGSNLNLVVVITVYCPENCL